jgi:predicted PurR-regulated permease PerM
MKMSRSTEDNLTELPVDEPVDEPPVALYSPPPPWTTLTRLIVATGSLFLLGWLGYTARPFIAPLVIAALLAYILGPAVYTVQTRLRLSYRWAVTAVYVLFLFILIATPGTLVPVLINQAQRLSRYLTDIEARFAQLLNTDLMIMGQALRFDEIWGDFIALSMTSLAPAAADAFRIIETTSVSLAFLLVILVTTYYLLLDWERLRDWFIGLAPVYEQPSLYRLLNEIDIIWRTYLRGTLSLMFIIGVLFIFIGAVIGLPGALAIGLLTGFLSMIPEVGLIIAGVLAVLVAYFQGSNVLPLNNEWFALMVALIYFVVRQIKASWLRPFFMGRFLNMNTGLIFVAIVGAMVVANIFIALIILPLIVSAGVIGRYVRCRLLDLDPWPEDQALTWAEQLLAVQKQEREKLASRRKKLRYGRRIKNEREQQLHS